MSFFFNCRLLIIFLFLRKIMYVFIVIFFAASTIAMAVSSHSGIVHGANGANGKLGADGTNGENGGNGGNGGNGI